MSDSSNDGSKEFNSSEVSSTCNVGRRNQVSEAEGASTSDAPIPRSLSPDTSDSANQPSANQGDDLTSTTTEPRPREASTEEEYVEAEPSGNNVSGSNERSWAADGEEALASSSRGGQPAVSESISKPWNMLVSYASTSEEEEDNEQEPPAETREISTTQKPPSAAAVSWSGDAVRDEGASSSEMRMEGSSSVSGSHDFNVEGEAGSSSNVLEDAAENQEALLTSSGNNNLDGVESSRLNQPELGLEEEEEETLTSSGHEAEAAVVEPEPVATVSGSDEQLREPLLDILSSSNNIVAALLSAERPASSEADPQVVSVRPDSPSSGRLMPEIVPRVPHADNLVAPSLVSAAGVEDGEAVPARRSVQGPVIGMPVLAQQLRVSSAGQGHSTLMRQLISSHHQPGPNRCGPDSTTVEQSASGRAEEVSTTDEDQLGQVSTSQQRGMVSTSWPAASGVSSSADSPISTSNMIGGLLASRLSRDPQVSTSVNTSSPLRDSSDLRDSNGASSTTSGLRGLLSTPARAGNAFARSNFSLPTQSSSPPVLPEPTDNAMSGHQPEMGSGFILSPQLSPSSSLRPTENQHSYLAQQLAGPSCATAPGDKFPGGNDKPVKKRKKKSPSPERGGSGNQRPPPPGPSREPPPSASLMEQLRKAGVIVTPVPTAVVENVVPPPQVTPEVDLTSDQDQQSGSLASTSKMESEDFESKSVVGDDEGQVVLVNDEEEPAPVPEKKRPGRKKGKRKPVELNPEMLRAKRPRRAKEKPEEEEKPKETPKKVEPPPTPEGGDVPVKKKRGRKPKALLLQMAAEAKAREEAEQKEREERGEEPSPEPEPEPEPVEGPMDQENETPSKPDKKKGKGKKVAKTPKTPKPKVVKPKPVRETPSKAQDEETRMSATATEDSQQGKADQTPRKRFVLPILQPLEVTADDLAEYQWPANDRLADTFMLQEQIALFLGVKSFKRKYPDLKRRPIEPQEREILQERGIVTESMCDLGLTAVLSSEVLDIMSADYHDKYEEYKRALREKLAKEMANKQKTPSCFKPVDAKTRAMQSAAKWNASFNRERKEERRCCCDLQTMTFHFPEHKRTTVMKRETTTLGAYPVPLISGQFTDFYKNYTPTELRYLPINTVMYGPLRPNEQLEELMSEGSQSDSDGSMSSDDSSSSDSSSDGSADSADSMSDEEPDVVTVETIANAPPAGTKCRSCTLPGLPENMVSCAQCSTSGHLLCLGLNTDMLSHIRRYLWQCTDCKTCIQCKDPADEDKMLFCDLCDRGYHIYCVGLRKVPEGRWHCRVCAVCGSCGSNDPSGAETPQPAPPPNSPDKAPQWQHEYKKGDKNSKVYAQTLCVPCSRLWRKGSYCQHCCRCYQRTDSSTMVNCSICDKWMHAECCNLAPGPELTKVNFVCDNCQEGSQVRNSGKLKMVAKIH